jgi:Protein-L-isoaspartate(D-aspartate) O-methyltransferase (PCMT).
MNNNLNSFFEKLVIFIDNKELVKLLLTNKRDKDSDLKKIIITIVSLKKGYFLNFVYRHNTKDITKNYQFKEGLELIKQHMENDFYNADLYSKNEDISLIIKPNGKVQINTKQPSLEIPASFNHDNSKNKLIKTANSIYLRELNIISNNWEVRREMSDKYKQINKYVELLSPYLTEKILSEDCHIVDMGAGKGYLTFALCDYITNTLNKKTNITGVEYRNDLVEECNLIAQKSNFQNLKFIQGTIEKTELEHIDILIALHACDTATDEAIYRGIKSNSSLIVCAPCCHKQIRKAFDVSNVFSNVVKYGILKERQAEIITDTIRAMILEAFGYKTNVFEFISTEHTPKNVMIVGEKSTISDTKKQQILNEIALLKQMFGIDKHNLESLLKLS